MVNNTTHEAPKLRVSSLRIEEWNNISNRLMKDGIMTLECKALTLSAADAATADARLVLVSDTGAQGSTQAWVAAALKAGELSKAGDVVQAFALEGIKAQRLLAAHAGDGSAKSLRKTVLAALKGLGNERVRKLVIDAQLALSADAWSTVVMAVHEAFYSYQTTKSATAKAIPKRTVSLAGADAEAVRAGMAHGVALWSGVALAREWANRPANHATPADLGEAAKALGKVKNISVKVMGPAEVKKLKMGAFLSVAAGSEQPLRFIQLEYKGAAASDAPVVLVGKGVTFDTGGISLKPGAGMDEMKFDMGGAASVLGAFQALGALQPAINVVGLIPACENMPSGRATKPGDVVTSMSGQTIEVLNTDAEGRLILCDALTYAKRFKPRHVIDIATLTGACVIALGHVRSGMYATSDALAHDLQAAGDAALDPCWRMPLDDEYADGLKSNFADIPNIAGRDAGSITAAKFLQKFVDFEWAHLDIAGTAWNSGANKGATGRPVPLLMQHLLGVASAQPVKPVKPLRRRATKAA